MTFAMTVLAFFVLGGIGWHAARHRTKVMTLATSALVLAGIVAILAMHGPAPRVVAGGMVGVMVGDLAAGFARRFLASPTRAERAS